MVVDRKALDECEIVDRLPDEDAVESGVFEDVEIVTGSVGAVADEVAEVVEPESSKIEFLSFEAFEAYLDDNADYLNREGIASPLRLVPEVWLKELVLKGYVQNPANMKELSYETENGTRIAGIYTFFWNTGINTKFVEWYGEARAFLATEGYGEAAALLASVDLGGRGKLSWEDFRPWWPDLVKDAFQATPFVRLKDLKFTVGEKSHAFESARKGASDEDQTFLRKCYDEVFEEYISRNFDRVLEYFRVADRFYWEEVPAKFHQEFLNRAFELTPFAHAEGLYLIAGGKKIGGLYKFYKRQGKGGISKFKRMTKKAMVSYLDSLDKIVEVLNDFGCLKSFGGVTGLPDNFLNTIICNAVLAAENCPTNHRSLEYVHTNGAVVDLGKIWGLFVRNGCGDKFIGWYENALALRWRLNSEKEEEKDREIVPNFETGGVASRLKPKEEVGAKKPKKKTAYGEKAWDKVTDKRFAWVLDPLDDLEMKELIARACAGDREAEFEFPRRFGRLIIKKAFFYTSDSKIAADLASEALLKLREALMDVYKPVDGKLVYSYAAAVLDNLFTTRKRFHMNGTSRNQASNVSTYAGRYRRAVLEATGEPGDFFGNNNNAEIAEVLGCSVNLVNKVKIRGKFSVSMNTTSFDEDDDSRVLEDTFSDHREVDASSAHSLEESSCVVDGLLEGVPHHYRMMVRRMMGIRSRGGTPFKEVVSGFRGEIRRKEALQVVGRFVDNLFEFLRKPSFTVSPEVVEELKGMVENSGGPRAVVAGKSELGDWLRRPRTGEEDTILARVVFSMKDFEKVLLLELFDVPCSDEDFTYQSLADVFSCERQNIHTMVMTAYRKMKVSMTEEYGVYEEADGVDDEEGLLGLTGGEAIDNGIYAL